MSIGKPKSKDLRKNQVTFQKNVKPENPDRSTNEAWKDHLIGVWLAIQDGVTREAEVLGRKQDERVLECWGRTEVLKTVEADMRFVWYDPQTNKKWNVRIDSHPVEIAGHYAFMKFAATATLLQDR